MPYTCSQLNASNLRPAKHLFCRSFLNQIESESHVLPRVDSPDSTGLKKTHTEDTFEPTKAAHWNQLKAMLTYNCRDNSNKNVVFVSSASSGPLRDALSGSLQKIGFTSVDTVDQVEYSRRPQPLNGTHTLDREAEKSEDDWFNSLTHSLDVERSFC